VSVKTGSRKSGATVSIPNYRVVRVLGEGHNAVVYQGYRQDDPDQQPLTLKVFKNIYPSPGQQARFRRELHLLQALDSPYLVQSFGLEEQGGLFLLVSHYQDNLYSLRDWLDRQPLSVDAFLKIALHLAQVLEDIHGQGVIHGDLKPSNILVDDNLDTIKLIDFGMSRIFQRQLAHFPEGVAGTLSYISPEQTGRTNKPVDYRSDFYSLGVTFFQVATGRLPFEHKDRLSLIHAHLAIEPPRAATLNPDLPAPLSELITWLMAKNPADRYQEASAIHADLEHCQTEWQATGQIAPFTLGAADRQTHFEISQKLYSRDTELEQLQNILDEVGQGAPQLVLVAGSAGIGKTSLVQALQPAIVAIRGLFIADKYDMYQRNIPYSALGRSLRTFLRHLLREAASVLQEWREAIQAAIGANGRVITDIVPELEHLLGPQPPLPDLPPEESRQRFQMTFSQFLRACGNKHQPLILFLDDLQWADDSSLDFLQAFLTDAQPTYLLVLGSYRDNEVGPDHRLQQLITQLDSTGHVPYQIELTPLDPASVRQLLLDTFRNGKDSGYDQSATFDTLAELLYHKSDANPFFLTTLLHTLYDTGLISHDAQTGWTWDTAAIQASHLSDDVVELLIQRLDRLPETTLTLLKQGACLGNTFLLSTLSLISDLDLDELYPHLEPAMQEDLIREEGDIVRFVHDRVREAVYRLLDEAEQTRQHWHIGQTMLAHYDEQTLEERLFTVMNQLNQGRSLATDPALQARLVELNYRAGLKARANIAFDASLSYLQIGRELLPEGSWQEDYDQAYKVWYELLIAHMLRFNREAAEAAADVILANAQSLLDRARCYRQLVLMHAWRGDFQQAVTVGNQMLDLYGQAIPTDPDDVRQALGAEMKHLGEHLTGPQVIADLPEMEDAEALVQMEIRYELTPTLYRISPQLLVLNNFRTIRLALEKGCHPSLSIAFGGSGAAMIALGQLERAVFFNNIAASLWDRYPNAFETAFGIVGPTWTSAILLPDLESIRRQNQRGQTLCKNVGNIFHWGTTYTIEGLTELVDGRNLAEALSRAQEARDNFFKRYEGNRWGKLLVNIIEGYLKPMADLEATDLATLEQEALEAQLLYNVFHVRIFAGMVSYTLGDYAAALDYLTRAQEYAASNPTGLINIFWQIYHALTLLALAQEIANDETITQAEELLAKVDALAAFSRTFVPYTAFIRAELAYVRQESTWHSGYFAAIDQAVGANYPLLQAIIHDRLATHLLAAGYRAGRGHIEEALYLFEQIGATAKVRQLQESYALYLHQPSDRELVSSTSSRDSSKSSSSSSDSQSGSLLHQDLDTYAILKASQAISSEIDLDRLLSTIMRTIGEVSGAESVYLITEEAGLRVIRARMVAGVTEPGEPIPVKNSNLVSEGIVRYVHRTGQTLLLDDAYNLGEFTDDAHIQARQVRSVLCHPIQEQNRLVGIIYLENNLSSHAFTPGRVEVVRLLASQAAISITNAQAIVARTEQERVQGELDIAYDVQRRMLPAKTPSHPNFDIVAISHAARRVSGDFYGFHQRPNGELVAGVGDVSGKGMPAALLMGAAVVAMTGAIEADLSPAKALTRINRVLLPHIISRQNVAVCLAYLENNQVCLANAGVISPVLRTQSRTEMLLDVGGLPLGTHLSDELPYEETVLDLSLGDLLVITSDGVVEATNARNEMYGFDRFEAAIAAGPTDSAQAMLDYLLADLRSFVGKAEQHDDITVVIIRMT
jgi:predicted ATPase/serine phosphatase RsbU (regulator of sigma subunit)